MTKATRRNLNVVALLVGEPQAVELWTLKNVATVSGSLNVVQATSGSGVSAPKRLRRLIREHGATAVASRVLGARLVGTFHERREQRRLERLFDGKHLREWWDVSGIEPIRVPHLNHEKAHSAIAALQPDIIVRVSGGVLKRATFGQARIAALNIHHGVAPRIRGMWSIPWGIVDGRDDWIGATVHEIDDGIDTGRVLWRGSPQIAPGDTATTLFFRAHLEVVDALVRLLRVIAHGDMPTFEILDKCERSVYRSAPGVGTWLRFLALREGTLSRVTLETALKR